MAQKSCPGPSASWTWLHMLAWWRRDGSFFAECRSQRGPCNPRLFPQVHPLRLQHLVHAARASTDTTHGTSGHTIHTIHAVFLAQLKTSKTVMDLYLTSLVELARWVSWRCSTKSWPYMARYISLICRFCVKVRRANDRPTRSSWFHVAWISRQSFLQVMLEKEA